MYSNITPSAQLAHENNPCQAATDALRAARSQVTARCCASDYWLKLSQRIQADAADYGNTGGMYAGIKHATGPTATKSVPLKTKSDENITTRRNRWSGRYSTQNIVTDAALDAIWQLPVMPELDQAPTKEELRKAIDCLSAGKAPGEDGIPGEVIKAGEELIDDLIKLLCPCRKEGFCDTRHARRQDSDSVQKQRKPQRSKQLLGSLPAEHRW